jgi:hypothetical protein
VKCQLSLDNVRAGTKGDFSAIIFFTADLASPAGEKEEGLDWTDERYNVS